MSKALDLFKPSQEQLLELRQYAKNDPELQEILNDHDITLNQVMKVIENMPKSGLKEFMKLGIPQVAFLHASEEAKTYLLYKTENERDKAIECAQKFKTACIRLSNKHNDQNELDKINKELNDLSIHNIKSVKPLSSWRQKSLSNFIENSKDKIKEIKQLESLDNVHLNMYDLEELKQKHQSKTGIKTSGPRLDDISCVQIETKKILADKKEVKTMNTLIR